MSTITKERIELFIKSPLENGLTRGEQMELARIALASLEAEPVAYIFKHPAGKLFWALTDESNKEQSDVIPVYAAPPVPVVPEEKPMPNPLKMYAVDAVAAIAEVRGWNACRAAMLYGAVPASQAYKLPQTQFKQVADLYEMQFDDGRTCTFHTDAQKAVQWLQACDGNRVQEYVKLERLQNALSGNSPVIPDGWISCSERMPEKNQNVLISVNFDSSLVEPLICSARYTGSTFRRGDATIKPGNGIEQATHWMPLPEPPQEVNRG
ncbi:DUF551 domain-containing protein [Salmonella enterica subsp. enterica serovar Meleagridis]|uniref:DUF551 domain-containing protein n=1 Tax=Enterobacteriaceae TaxID=543 RepID=UPI00092AABC4|nr:MULTISPECIES: DUF551 domain-containing protein [Enterobacteriaceae]ECF6844746.1 DUF551 domain-containing protein [Salmonella enterica subsp. enterica serovar Meleagridis]EDQ7301488.1 DUF551 domain-containing protein [Salmonella enterica subsp. enterica serovar Meleagridis]EEA7924303.1 DUF551 domain-containing protein [Salmonella enterica subsp. enterica serovar Meleagridis]EGM7031565.1 DUF551 domain-containing protein [Salmonella enterica subsp. enterica serovar Meleagridis]EGZ4322015.1 DUF